MGAGSCPVNSKACSCRECRVLDIGAQSGFYSLLLSRLVGPEGMVFAFEPLPANFRILEENVSLNNIQNVTIRPRSRIGAARVISALSFRTRRLPSSRAHLSKATISVRFRSLRYPSMISFARPDSPIQFIKMDVEGAETAVLRGAVQTLKSLSSSHDRRIALMTFLRTGSHPAISPAGRVGIPNRVAERSWLSFSHLCSMDSEQHRETGKCLR